ncbi:DUF4381 domain-containing protein [Vibrio methylphosphonaticus]|uniref:DUF4381 domain-containing protein n=1 Tax=Vibrio methylphosphonaticus TaxID=2946866 RepID=UPI00202A6B40|nr:DUF4381 domain-containing protein [Vibrio methylphosphonaticus]MCL9773829.1 DUF4381 domain-containing protein [Vibrio methylphosphonaticus]
MTPTISHPLELSSLTLPAAPSWWPLGPGWWISGLVLAFIIVGALFCYRRNKQKTRAKRAALNLFKIERDTLTPSSAIEVVRQAALSYYPRQDIAKLNGQSWYQFLDSQLAESLFFPNQTQWNQALYCSKHAYSSHRSETLNGATLTNVKDHAQARNKEDADAIPAVSHQDIEHHTLVADCERWIQQALPPKRKYRNWNRG